MPPIAHPEYIATLAIAAALLVGVLLVMLLFAKGLLPLCFEARKLYETSAVVFFLMSLAGFVALDALSIIQTFPKLF